MAPESLVTCKSCIENGWFVEKNPQWPGQANALKIEEVLFQGESSFQDVMIFKSATHGTVLVLDGVIQVTERDECSYQEMVTHLPMAAHGNAKRVLVIGGGDGGVLREFLLHDSVDLAVMCEIDSVVVDQCCNHFSTTLSTALVKAPRAATADQVDMRGAAAGGARSQLLVGDGLAFAQGCAEATFDVIVVDSTDPAGPAEGLFSAEFYANVHRILTPDGIVASQCECLWMHMDLIREVFDGHAEPFAEKRYASMQVPTYPSGQIGAAMFRKAGPVCHAAAAGAEGATMERPAANFKTPIGLRYYSARMHEAAFALPAFATEAIYGKAQ